MPRKRYGYTQVPFEIPDELLIAVQAAARAEGLKLTAFICSACADRAGVEYTPPRLGRPPAEPKNPAPRRRGKSRRG